MKIVGGSFGLAGKAHISADGELIVKGARAGKFARTDIASIAAKRDQERKFGLIGAILGALILGAVLGAAFGPIGAAIGIILAIGGSFYTKKQNLAEVAFKSGDTLTLEGSGSEISRLIALQGQPG